MTVVELHVTEKPFRARRTRVLHTPLRKHPTPISVTVGDTDPRPVRVTIGVREDTEVEVIRLKTGATTLIFRDSATGSAVEVTLSDAEFLRTLALVDAVNPRSASAS